MEFIINKKLCKDVKTFLNFKNKGQKYRFFLKINFFFPFFLSEIFYSEKLNSYFCNSKNKN